MNSELKPTELVLVIEFRLRPTRAGLLSEALGRFGRPFATVRSGMSGRRRVNGVAAFGLVDLKRVTLRRLGTCVELGLVLVGHLLFTVLVRVGA